MNQKGRMRMLQWSCIRILTFGFCSLQPPRMYYWNSSIPFLVIRRKTLEGLEWTDIVLVNIVTQRVCSCSSGYNLLLQYTVTSVYQWHQAQCVAEESPTWGDCAYINCYISRWHMNWVQYEAFIFVFRSSRYGLHIIHDDAVLPHLCNTFETLFSHPGDHAHLSF